MKTNETEHMDDFKDLNPTDDEPVFKPKNKRKAFIIIASIFIVLLIIIPFATQIFVNIYVENKIRSAIADSGFKHEVNWSKVHYNILKKELSISRLGINFPNAPILIDSFRVPSLTTNSLNPLSLTIYAENFSVPVIEDIFHQYTKMLNNIGYTYFKGNAEIKITLGESNVLNIDIPKLLIFDMGNLKGHIAFQNVSERNPAKVIKSLKEKEIKSASITLQNNGAVEKVLAFYSTYIMQPSDVAKLSALRAINRRIDNLAQTDSAAKQNLTQLYNFFDNPRSITIALRDGSEATINSLNDLMPRENESVPPSDSTGYRRVMGWIIRQPISISAQ